MITITIKRGACYRKTALLEEVQDIKEGMRSQKDFDAFWNEEVKFLPPVGGGKGLYSQVMN